MNDRLLVVDFAEGLLVDLLFIVGLILLVTGCSSLKAAGPPEIVAAEHAIAQAEQAGVAQHLPTTMQRARDAVAQAHLLNRQNQTEASATKATEASLLVDQAVLLDQRRKAWDLEIEKFVEEQVSQQLMALLLVELTQRLDGDDDSGASSSDDDCATKTSHVP